MLTRCFCILLVALSVSSPLIARPRHQPLPPTSPMIVKQRLRHPYPAVIYELLVPKLPCGEIAFINGMNHKPDRAVRCAGDISEKACGYNVFVVYNPTDGFIKDIAKCFVELYHFEVTPPVTKLHEKWDMFFANCKGNEKCLQFCHSEGAIQVRNALLTYPPHLRKRIIVVAIAPAAYIPDEICGEVYHYASRRDIVPKIDRMGRKRCAHSTVILTPHSDATFLDHHFSSPTFQEPIHYHLNHYLQSVGVSG